MKVKRMKQHRKCVRFFTTCYGFREPYKVFCDGTFIHHLVQNQITEEPSQALANILGKPTKLFTTRCVIAELHSFGESFSKTFEAARNLSLARCDHEKRKGAATCVGEVIGEKNSEHFFLATQDNELRTKFRMTPGVPIIYGLRKSLILEPQSEASKDFVKSSEDQRLHMTEMEKTLLKKGIGKIITGDGDATSDAHEASVDEVTRDALTSGPRRIDGPQFKRKKPKGPNPLSRKKKKITEKPSGAPNKDGDDSAKRNRKRKRSRRGTKSEGGDA